MCYSHGDFLAYTLGIHDWNAAMTAPMQAEFTNVSLLKAAQLLGKGSRASR